MFVRDMPSLVNCIPRLHNKSILKGCMGHRPSETHRRSNLDVYRMAAPSMATTKTTASSTRVGEINSSERDNVTSSNDASPTSITRPEQVLQDLVAVALRQEQQRLQQQQQEQQTLLDATIGLLQAHRQAMALVTWPATLHRTSSKGPHDILGTNNRFILGTGTGPTEPVQDLSRQSLILALLNGTSRP